ncbi:putative toxin-antitoxin system toxin component, PIN family [Candidatus Roizmanbacteria bacterium RIFCSPHIGHO2_01_FULL_35_10]|uniref:Putative toxin-antitoxin system toxin component, PIN family n=1 Tax=Candidatus Roizmanbacteria bacterium RIFCSPLOWO2_01_FULL_35_13 TaxID=1802055 RepID=A0A1F7IF28_9BACT|nr:MAG: putative toxin-antitoxin system toxin component, PIN family [Candidatus Roizmanbacteria bacterium RIFCSPHIGHO2_01_FULL_35_10]OGK41971.1 MAG: putative toxin-antitoxin system toxin component, PIN family [Candidatus Roizmanbacteria bacterium RIFCSPLOWO2_01_FULL_35_13]
MYNIILDTNILLSAFLFKGFSRKIIDQIVEEKLSLFISQELKKEVLRKFKELGASKEASDKLLFLLENKAILYEPRIKISVCRDKQDNFILELAETSKAEFIITRDKDLLDLLNKKWKKTKIVKPEDFLTKIRRRSEKTPT